MSDQIVRRASYIGQLNGERCEFHIKKWSATKLIFNVKSFGSVIKRTIKEIGNDEGMTEATLIANLIVSMCEYAETLQDLVAKDLIKPELTGQEIGELDPEDFLGIVEKIFDLNLTEGLKKKFLGLLKSVIPQKVEAVAEGAEASETEARPAAEAPGKSPVATSGRVSRPPPIASAP